MISGMAKRPTGIVGCTKFRLQIDYIIPQNRREGGFALKVEKKIIFSHIIFHF